MTKTAIAGSGALLTPGEDIAVEYDLVEARTAAGATLEGTIFGDPEKLRQAFLKAEHRLRLESGEVLRVLILDAGVEGAADVRAIRR